jgi:hypothetical protein
MSPAMRVLEETSLTPSERPKTSTAACTAAGRPSVQRTQNKGGQRWGLALPTSIVPSGDLLIMTDYYINELS